MPALTSLAATIQSDPPWVVGAVSDSAILRTTIAPVDCDLVELRLDALGTGPEVDVFVRVHEGKAPLLITARHPDEGGSDRLSAAERGARLEKLLPAAACLDLELRSLGELAPLWEEAGRRGVLRIASWHHFTGCPPVAELRERVAAMHTAGADVAKIAVRLVTPADMQTLAAVLEEAPPLPLSVMGMGPLAPASRLLAAQLGSVLNYGYLGRTATAPGQWPARLLKEALAHSPRAAADSR